MEILADRLWRDIKTERQVVNADTALRPRKVDNLLLPLGHLLVHRRVTGLLLSFIAAFCSEVNIIRVQEGLMPRTGRAVPRLEPVRLPAPWIPASVGHERR